MRVALRQPYKQFFGTLANQGRLDIIEALRKGALTVNEISIQARQEQSSVSHNLRRLEECGFVEIAKKGREKIVTLNQNTIRPLLELMDTHMHNYCQHVVARKDGTKEEIACHQH